MPFVLLLFLEVLLRLVGYGYPTQFFLKSQVGGGPVYIENQEFTKRFFPPGLSRSPQPVVVPAEKAPDACRIFIFGESAAMGDPEPAYGFGRILELLLRERYPGKQFQVVNVAITAINSHVIRQIAHDCAPLQGDVWILYIGNNEVVGPFGAGTVFGSQTPPPAAIRAQIALKATRLGQGLDALKWRLAHPSGTPVVWEGMEMFLKQQIRQDDPRMARVYDNFRRNLEEIVRTGLEAHQRLLISTVVGNLKDCPPFASLHWPGFDPARLAEWEKLYAAGAAAESVTNYAAALSAYQQAAALDDRYAELQFRVGRCHWALGHYAEAKTYFEQAQDLDTLRFRSDTRINQIIRQVADRHAAQGIKWFDAREVFARNSPHGIVGEELLYEHVHLNFNGNYLLARVIAEQIASLLPARITAGSNASSPPLTVEECARRLALTDWDRAEVLDEVYKRLQQPPFIHQLDHEARDQRLREQRAALRLALGAAGYAAAVPIYRQALATSPTDWVLHENLAKLLQTAGEPAAAEKEWREVTQLVPHYEQGYYGLANALDAQGRAAEAIAVYRRSLQRRPDLHEARNGLGLALANLGNFSEAIAQYQQALKGKPDFGEARVNLGLTLAQQGKAAEAMAQYQAALQLNSNNAAAHINLGKLLAVEGKTDEAIAHYRDALRLNPDNAVAHYNLGNALATRNDAEALGHYREAARLKPDFAEARHNLGLGLARLGKTEEALAQFTEAVRLQPDFAEGHLNLGVALARERRYDEAIAQFREVLRLNPSHPQARKFLEQATALKPR
jgi:tetratricopeptide (TPR) repeat protein